MQARLKTKCRPASQELGDWIKSWFQDGRRSHPGVAGCCVVVFCDTCLLDRLYTGTSTTVVPACVLHVCVCVRDAITGFVLDR